MNFQNAREEGFREGAFKLAGTKSWQAVVGRDRAYERLCNFGRVLEVDVCVLVRGSARAFINRRESAARIHFRIRHQRAELDDGGIERSLLRQPGKPLGRYQLPKVDGARYDKDLQVPYSGRRRGVCIERRGVKGSR